jgi:SnoaL-like domain
MGNVKQQNRKFKMLSPSSSVHSMILIGRGFVWRLMTTRPCSIRERFQCANGRAEFEKTFQVVFQQIRGNRVAAPYMDLQPKDMVIQEFGDVAIATFHLDDRPGVVNRRTIVLHKTKTGWKIVQLHASEVSITKAPR